MYEGDGFSVKTLGKSHWPAGKFWLVESTLGVDFAERRFKLCQTSMLTWWQAATFLWLMMMSTQNKIVTILNPRSHLAASALCWASCQSVSDTWSLEGTRSWRKWYCGHQSDRSFQSSPKLFFSCVAKYMRRVSENASHSLIHCREAAWSSLMKKAASASRSPFDWSAE